MKLARAFAGGESGLVFRWRTAMAVVIVLAALTGAYGGKKKEVPGVVRREGAHVSLADLEMVAARQKCANWGWAAALETVLHARHVELPQSYWIDRIHGGRCEDDVLTLEDTARLLSGEYQDADGGKFRLEATFTAGPPPVVDDMLLTLMAGVPMVVYYKARPYVLTGMVYDEAWYPTGNKLFDVQELELRDPLSSEEVKFTKGTDRLEDIGGVLRIRVVRE